MGCRKWPIERATPGEKKRFLRLRKLLLKSQRRPRCKKAEKAKPDSIAICLAVLQVQTHLEYGQFYAPGIPGKADGATSKTRLLL